MWETLFLVAAWITMTPPDLCAYFSQPVTTDYYSPSNYTISEITEDGDSTTLPIYSIERIFVLDGDTVKPAHHTLLCLIIPKPKERSTIITDVHQNIDLQHNYYFNNNYAPNLEIKPDLIIKEE
ncbi:MAG: hypothetical protein JETCAE03_34440 [Ignavibacteriaceae bacterium]|jgi:hypothetical protein|nr:MAG: hypothetical protein JETCAE03_34440 [Ignavibacteriaceae bacterium]